MWRGALTAGYGAIRRGARGAGVAHSHRLSWEIHNGPIPDGMWVLHRCDVRACVRPDHLWLGTQQENNADCVAKGRNAKGDTRGFNKLSSNQVRAIRALRERGWEYQAIAPLFGVGTSAVALICRRLRWQHLV